MTSNVISIPATPNTDLVDINIDETPRYEQIDKVREALALQNVPTPVHFRHDGKLAKVDFSSSNGEIVLVPQASVAEIASRAFHWTRRNKGGVIKHVDPPPMVIRAVAASPGDRLPRLRKIVDIPFITPSGRGRIVQQPGYDAESEVYLNLNAQFDPVPDAPTHDEFDAAVDLLAVEALRGFVFADAASQANAVAAQITHDVMSLYPDMLTPVFASDAPENNFGKTYLPLSIVAPVVGYPPDVTPMTMTDGPECRRTIYALLRDHPEAIILDNIASRFAGDALAAVLTSRRTKDRAIKTSTSPTVENTTLWFATGKNLSFSTEMRLRAVLIQLVAPPIGNRNPIKWAVDNRYAIVRARLIVIRRWITMGRPLSTTTHPKYPEWAAVVGGILDVIGIPDFLANQHLLSARDDEAAAWEDLVDRWAALQPGAATRRRVKAIIAGAAIPGEPAWDVVADGRDDDSRAKILGHALRDRVDRPVGAWVIRSSRNSHDKVHEYWLEPAMPSGAPLPPPPPPSATPPSVPSSTPSVSSSATPSPPSAPSCGVCGVPPPSPAALSRDPGARARGRDQGSQNPANPAGGLTSWAGVAADSVAADPTSPLAQLVRRGRSKK